MINRPVEFSEESTQKKSYYKYRALYQIGANRQREPNPNTMSIFTNAEIYYSTPKDFNDPFDCNLKLHVTDSTDAEWEEYCVQLADTSPENKTNLLKAKKLKLWRTHPEQFLSLCDNYRRKIYHESSMHCFSKRKDSIPMFSYYADEHRGIVAEFTFADCEVPCGFSLRDPGNPHKLYGGKIVIGDAIYPPTFPELNYHRLNKREMIDSLIFTKYNEWAHEDEFRIFRDGIPAALVQFDRKILTRVIFGCRTTQADVELVKSWLSGWPSDVVLSKAEPAVDQFKLFINDFDLVTAT